MKTENEPIQEPKRVAYDLLIAALLFLVALAVRFYQLDTIPPGLYNDEAAYALDAMDVLDGKRALFFERNNGREPLFIYYLALVFNFFGASPFTIRAAAALIGALTAPATFWLAAASARFEFPHKHRLARWVGAWVGLFLALSYWHIALSRLGFRAITLPLVMSLAFVFVWRALRRLRDEEALPWLDLVLAGALLGATLYTYTAGRMALGVFGFAMLLAWLRAKHLGFTRGQIVRATLVMSAVLLIISAPLLGYFITQPAAFGERAIEVSIFNRQFAPDGPLRAFVDGAVKLALMFVSQGDANPRHNPALRPVLDPLLAFWFAAGIVLAFVQWRKLTPLVYVAWIGLLAVPSLISAEGVPHSLRTIGLMPTVFVLAVGAMLWAGRRLFARAKTLALLLPLPFLLVSSVISLQSYFGAWQSLERFQTAFMINVAQLANAITQNSGSEESSEYWLLTLSPAYFDPNVESYVVEFFVRDQVEYAGALVEEGAAATTLGAIPAGVEQVRVLRPFEKSEIADESFIYLDVKGLLDFLLRKSGAQAAYDQSTVVGDIPYSIYTLTADRNFTIPAMQAHTPLDFGNAVQLNGVIFNGAGSHSAESAHATIASDQPLWVVLELEALRALDYDLKASLTLTNEQGRVVAQTDNLLAADRYPVARVWNSGETTRSYAILEALPAIEPGEYTLNLRIYEDATGRIYPVAQADGTPASSVALGSVTLTAPAAITTVEPPTLATGALAESSTGSTNGNVRLLGYDPLPEQVAPGERIALTLYWQAAEEPGADLTSRIRLINAEGEVVALYEELIGGAHYPTSAWRAGEMMRQMPVLQVDTDAPGDEYLLEVALLEDGVARAEEPLGAVLVQGRPRTMEMPAVDAVAHASFGNVVNLTGLQLSGAPSADDLRIEAGAPISLTLVWQPQSTSDANLVRFAQLLNSQGVLVAQQDIIPCAEACPAASWIAGEYLLDPVTLALADDLAAGEYQMVTGWYDAETQQRLPATDGDGQPLANDVYVLPVRWTK